MCDEIVTASASAMICRVTEVACGSYVVKTDLEVVEEAGDKEVTKQSLEKSLAKLTNSQVLSMILTCCMR